VAHRASLQLIVKTSPTGPQQTFTPLIRRERSVFAGIGRELVQCKTDRLGGSRIQAQLWAVDIDPRTNKIRKVRELGAHQIFDIDSLPLVPDQQILIGRERLNALGEAPDKVFGVTSRGLAGDCLHKAEHVLGAMIDLTHQKMNLLLVSFPLGDIL
jgi:hypothetical protein